MPARIRTGPGLPEPRLIRGWPPRVVWVEGRTPTAHDVAGAAMLGGPSFEAVRPVVAPAGRTGWNYMSGFWNKAGKAFRRSDPPPVRPPDVPGAPVAQAPAPPVMGTLDNPHLAPGPAPAGYSLVWTDNAGYALLPNNAPRPKKFPKRGAAIGGGALLLGAGAAGVTEAVVDDMLDDDERGDPEGPPYAPGGPSAPGGGWEWDPEEGVFKQSAWPHVANIMKTIASNPILTVASVVVAGATIREGVKLLQLNPRAKQHRMGEHFDKAGDGLMSPLRVLDSAKNLTDFVKEFTLAGVGERLLKGGK